MNEWPTFDHSIEAKIRFARGGGRSFIAHQYVPYPFHITKPHRLHPDRPDIATVCLQSASGGLYRGDRLRLSVATGRCAAANLVSQAATVVHTATQSIAVQTNLSVGPHSFLAYFADPYVLFPGTSLDVLSNIVIDRSAVAIVAEGFDGHDPGQAGRPFNRLRSRTCVRDPCGRLLADDDSELAGTRLAGDPLGSQRAVGSVMLLGRWAAFDLATALNPLDALGLLAGASELPNGVGVQFRLLAADGGHLVRGMRAVYVAAFRQALTVSATRSSGM